MIDLGAIKKAICDLEEDDVMEILHDFIATNPSEEEIHRVILACQDGMAVVGDRSETGEYFIGDLIFAGELLMEAIDILNPKMKSEVSAKPGTIVLGSAHGDLHDIGKNIFKSMATAMGLKVYDLGIDQPAEAFADKVREVEPDIVGISGAMTLVLESMKDTVDALVEAGVRDSVKIIIGGNPVTKEACDYIGADAYTTNAVDGVRIVKAWIDAFYSISDKRVRSIV